MGALDASQDREAHEIDSGGRSESDDGLRAGDIGELAALDLWLTLAEPGSPG